MTTFLQIGIYSSKSRGLAGVALLLLVFMSLPVRGSIISVGGLGELGQVIAADEAVAVGFELSQSFSDVAIDVEVSCSGCSGGIWLQKNVIGSSATFADSIFAGALGGVGSPFVTGLSLDLGQYFLIISVSSGSATWTRSSAPIFELATGAALLPLEFDAADLQPFVPKSDFDALFAPGLLHFTVSAPIAIAETATWWLFAMGVLVLILVLRNRGKRESRSEALT